MSRYTDATARALYDHYVSTSLNLGQYRTEYTCGGCGEQWMTDGHSMQPQPSLLAHAADVLARAALIPTDLIVAAVTHAVEQYGGPDDDTVPVLRGWLAQLAEATS